MPEFTPILNVSALNGTNGFRLDGDALGDYSGRAVAGGGDVNGDGFADLLIGAHFSNTGGDDRGLAWLVFGAAMAPATQGLAARVAAGTAYRFQGEAAGDRLGYAIANAGDVNGDGFDDFIVGAYGADPDVAVGNRGASYLVFGGAANLEAFDAADATNDNQIALANISAATGYRFDGVANQDNSGESVSGAGDVNGDGFADLLIGASRADVNGGAGNGASYIVFGGANLVTLDGEDGTTDGRIDLANISAGQGLRLDGATTFTYDYSGRSVTLVGDVNGDGFGDALVGALFADPNGTNTNEGAAYLVFGKAQANFTTATLQLAALSGLDGTRFDGAASLDRTGGAVNGVGDVNADGLADIVIGARTANSYAGSAYVVFGANAFGASSDLSALTGANGFRLDGPVGSVTAGISVSAAGDVNGDGFADILVTAVSSPGNPSNAGTVYVVFGKASGFAATIDLGTLDGDTGFRIEGAGTNDRLGRGTFGAAGDVNGDGFDDIVVASYGAGNNLLNASGSTYVVYGHRADTAVTRTGTAIANRMNGGQGVDTISGLGGNDTLIGWEDNDTLSGGDGADTIDGGTGNDAMTGGIGNDTYVSDVVGDTITELLNQGFDTVNTTRLSFTLAANVERVNYTGSGNFIGTGNNLANRFQSASGSDRFVDVLGGADIFSGGAGTDTVDFRTSATGAILNFTTNIHGGAALGDSYSGIEKFLGSNTAADTMTAGGVGRVVFVGGGGGDTLTGGVKNDQLIGEDGDDILSGGADRDSLDGGLGNDTMTGGIKGDVFVFGDAVFGQDTITDYEDGIDSFKVFSSVADDVTDFTIAGNGTNTVILTLIGAPANTITLNGAATINITNADFVFV